MKGKRSGYYHHRNRNHCCGGDRRRIRLRDPSYIERYRRDRFDSWGSDSSDEEDFYRNQYAVQPYGGCPKYPAKHFNNRYQNDWESNGLGCPPRSYQDVIIRIPIPTYPSPPYPWREDYYCHDPCRGPRPPCRHRDHSSHPMRRKRKSKSHGGRKA